jgi:hypothetical protein
MILGFSKNLLAKTRILSSKSDFTSDKIALEFLKNYVENSDTDLNAE